jgi:hypothetical protein
MHRSKIRAHSITSSVRTSEGGTVDALNLERGLPVLTHKLPRTTLGAVTQ